MGVRGLADSGSRTATIHAHLALGYKYYSTGQFAGLGALLDAGAALAPGLTDSDDLALRSHLLVNGDLVRWRAPRWLIDVDPMRLVLETPRQRQHATMLANALADRDPSPYRRLNLEHEVSVIARRAMTGPVSDPADISWLLDSASHLASAERLDDASALLSGIAEPTDPVLRPSWHHRHTLIALRRGEAVRAGEHAARLDEVGGELSWYHGRAIEYQALALELQGRRAEASQLADQGLAENPTDAALRLLAADLRHDDAAVVAAVPDVLGFQPARLQPHLRAAKAHLRRGQADLAIESLRREVALQEASGTYGMAAEALAELASIGTGPARAGRLEEAVALAEQSERHHSRGAVLARFGDHLRGRGDLTAARRAYETTLDLAVADGRHQAALDAERLLRLAGGRPRRLRSTGPLALTPSQRQVAELVAAGLTNRQIAAELWLTEKTIESHLRAAFRTLGVQRRQQVAEQLTT